MLVRDCWGDWLLYPTDSDACGEKNGALLASPVASGGYKRSSCEKTSKKWGFMVMAITVFGNKDILRIDRRYSSHGNSRKVYVDFYKREYFR